jgi:hypothetical protein
MTEGAGVMKALRMTPAGKERLGWPATGEMAGELAGVAGIMEATAGQVWKV